MQFSRNPLIWFFSHMARQGGLSKRLLDDTITPQQLVKERLWGRSGLGATPPPQELIMELWLEHHVLQISDVLFSTSTVKGKGKRRSRRESEV